MWESTLGRDLECLCFAWMARWTQLCAYCLAETSWPGLFEQHITRLAEGNGRPWACLHILDKLKEAGKGGAERCRGGAWGKRELAVRVDVRALPKGKKIGLSPRCYYPASSNLLNPLSGEPGGEESIQKADTQTSILPAERGRRGFQMQAAAAHPHCLQAHGVYLILAAKHMMVPAGPTIPPLGRLLAHTRPALQGREP